MLQEGSLRVVKSYPAGLFSDRRRALMLIDGCNVREPLRRRHPHEHKPVLPPVSALGTAVALGAQKAAPGPT